MEVSEAGAFLCQRTQSAVFDSRLIVLILKNNDQNPVEMMGGGRGTLQLRSGVHPCSYDAPCGSKDQRNEKEFGQQPRQRSARQHIAPSYFPFRQTTIGARLTATLPFLSPAAIKAIEPQDAGSC